MRRLLLSLFIILAITAANNKNGSVLNYIRTDIKSEQKLTPMEALDVIKKSYASNFEKVYQNNSDKDYYYRLPSADYYLEYEGEAEEDRVYLFHLYEFVLDDSETGVGHTVTYGWYTVNRENGLITDQTY